MSHSFKHSQNWSLQFLIFQNPKDPTVSTHRSHGHYLGKGGALLDELHGLSAGCSTGNGGSPLTDAELDLLDQLPSLVILFQLGLV